MKYTLRVFLFCILSCLSLLGNAQPNVVFSADFDDCDAFDSVAGRIGDVTGNPACECGVNGSAFRFDGLNDSIGFQDGIEDILNDDFAISLYFFLDVAQGSNEAVDIVSFGNNECPRDSTLTVRYIPQTNSIRTEVSVNESIIFNMIGGIPGNTCWNYLVINKNDDRLEMYINDELVADNLDFDRNFEFKPNGILSIGGSPCTSRFTSRFRGIIDEFRIYDRPLVESDVLSENQRPDQIITEDQTIFTGESLNIETGNNCTGSFSWSPTDNLADFMTKNPIASPEETSTYFYTVNYGTCFSRDSIRISIVEPGESQCDKLLLPNAFTPNNDRRNDEYGISNDFIVDDLKSFEIFSKWGEKVFEAMDINDKWDGNYKGQQMMPGTLLYRIIYDCNGEEFCATGSFVLVR